MRLLDHGYIELVESWGSDERVIESARMSTAKGFLGWGPRCKQCGEIEPGCAQFHDIVEHGDEKLLKFLWDHQHQTPFEMAGFTIEVKAPIFVFREWHRHRVPFGYNEMSSRYVPLPDENYVPTIERLLMNSKTNKQAGVVAGAAELDELTADGARALIEDTYTRLQNVYEFMLNAGVPKELARVILPVGRYSVMRATSNLRGWLAFMKLRCAPNAQWEIRQYANAVAEIVKEKFPRTYEVAREGLGLP